MAFKKAVEERVSALVAEILAEEEALGLGGELKNINDIESEMVRVGDMVAREFGRRKLADHTSRVCENPQCPRCGSAGEPLGQEARELITTRGPVPVTEAKYRCPKCRRLFFPSDRKAGA